MTLKLIAVAKRRFKSVLRTSSSNVAMSLDIKNHLFSVKTAYACYFVYKISGPLPHPLRTMMVYYAGKSENSGNDQERHMKVVYLTTPQRPVIGPDGTEKSPSTMNKMEGIGFPRMRKDVVHDSNKDDEQDEATTTLPTLCPDRDLPIIDIRLRPIASGRWEDVSIIVQDFDSDYSASRLASPFPQNPNKTDPTANEILDTHCNVQYERRTKYKNESRDSLVCGFIIECLKNTIPIWKRSSKKPYFFGTITLLTLLYLEWLRFDGVDVERGRPSICCWNASTMRLREELEMASGGFGMGVIQDIVGREETQ
ncbi:hypothetical protein L2E82_49149 [Cichorium intybus]|uniref:Uncharacterized protein n=1 Tax=Cichorium intybus TaxID=13427 RepID=A0ACB8YZS6_CICIN|nr:hypothetical protein L2E82_49149 [Cichorium intybus]